jgi:hypothetical protein
MDRMLRREVLPTVRRRSSFVVVVVVVVCSAMLMPMEKIKGLEKQRRSTRLGLTKVLILEARAGFEILGGANHPGTKFKRQSELKHLTILNADSESALKGFATRALLFLSFSLFSPFILSLPCPIILHTFTKPTVESSLFLLAPQPRL